MCASLDGPAGQVLRELSTNRTTEEPENLLQTRLGTEKQAVSFQAKLRARRTVGLKTNPYKICISATSSLEPPCLPAILGGSCLFYVQGSFHQLPGLLPDGVLRGCYHFGLRTKTNYCRGGSGSAQDDPVVTVRAGGPPPGPVPVEGLKGTATVATATALSDREARLEAGNKDLHEIIVGFMGPEGEGPPPACTTYIGGDHHWPQAFD